jgi:hypothetical protein|tara:strand:- start:2142 stop:2678 length:537 start_codon:yes stop_codon:yes gene_type:complete
VSEKRPETDEDILSRSKALTRGFAKGEISSIRKRTYKVDLSAHMAVCDINYQRMLKLFPKMREQDEIKIALTPGADGTFVVIKALERSPYTTLLYLSQQPELNWGSSPNMRIRMYHDSSSAEVIEYQHENRFHGHYEYPNQRMRHPDEKVQLNRFLSEYLSLCLTIGGVVEPVKLTLE